MPPLDSQQRLLSDAAFIRGERAAFGKPRYRGHATAASVDRRALSGFSH